MRDRVVGKKVGNRSGIGKTGSGGGQRPAKRGPAASISARFKSLSGYVPLALRFAVIAIVCLIAFVGYRAAASEVFFRFERWRRAAQHALQLIRLRLSCVEM